MASNNGIFFSQKEAAVSPEREPKVLMGGSGTGGGGAGRRGHLQTLIVFSNYKILEKNKIKKVSAFKTSSGGRGHAGERR